MSAHRITYRPPPQRRPVTWRSILAAIAVAATLGFSVIAISRGAEDVGPVASPVRTPDVVVFPLEPIDGPRLAQIRAESFRAGLSEGLQQSCGVPVLDRPLAAR